MGSISTDNILEVNVDFDNEVVVSKDRYIELLNKEAEMNDIHKRLLERRKHV